MTFSKLRGGDMARERVLADYLDKNLYSKDSPFSGVRRTDSLEEQTRGCDLIASLPGHDIKEVIIDEKSQGHYLDGGLPTFAFELNFLTSSGNRVEGWLTDEGKVTEYYMLLWLTADKGYNSIEGIHKVEYAFVERKKLLDFFASNGYDRAALREKGREISRSGQYGPHDKDTGPFYFFNSLQLAEKPVNVVVRKATLLKMAVIHGLV